MNIIEAKARRAAGKAVRKFEAQVAHRRDALGSLIFEGYSDPFGRVDVTDVTLSVDGIDVSNPWSLVSVTAVVELSRTRHDEHLTDDDLERVARAAFDSGRTYLVEEDFAAAVTATPAPDLSALTDDIETVLNFMAPARVDFKVKVVIGALHEDVAALGFNVFYVFDAFNIVSPNTAEDFGFAARAEDRLYELAQLAAA